jgi:hypothetical protein
MKINRRPLLKLLLWPGVLAAAAFAGPPPPPSIQVIDLRADRVPASEIVHSLRSRSCASVSFIPVLQAGTVSVDAKRATVPEILSQVARTNPAYRSETIDGRDVLYPAAPEFQTVLKEVAIQRIPRQTATETYVDLLRTKVPAFATLVAPWVIGDERRPLFTDPVSVRSTGRVIEQLVDLLGDDRNLYFEFIQARSGRPFIGFARVRCITSSH